jgi:prepilin-type processing-associated H-X9-DG protein/prepilin-type N-terminal cleavage/methylation domain-containing protein
VQHITRETRAFTLVELMVVVGIIGILAGLLLTAFSQAKAKANSIKCLNNIRQLNLGVSQFVSDYHVYPLFINGSFFKGKYPEHHTTWISAIGRGVFEEGSDGGLSSSNRYYMKGIWRCPAAKPPDDLPRGTGYSDYGYNAYGIGNVADPIGVGGMTNSVSTEDSAFLDPVPEDRVASPSLLMVLGDGFKGGNSVIRDGWPALSRVPQGEEFMGSTKRSGARHRGKANVAFGDGHATAVPLKTLFAETSEDSLKMWNRDNTAHISLVQK